MGTERTISPAIAKMTHGDKALCGASRMVFCEHEGKTLFGGIAAPNISKETDGNWHMAVGSLIFVPLKTLVWAQDECGWSLEDFITGDGLQAYNWKEK
ncbi:MAG TPA: hypothetical protein ENI27_09370 [bacterium]|nr:hypothetical protein [bacterium]